MLPLLTLSTILADAPALRDGFAEAVGGVPVGWLFDAPRDEVKPRIEWTATGGVDGGSAVSLTGVGDRTFGTLTRTVDGARAGQWYRFGVSYRVGGVAVPSERVRLRVLWLDAAGRGLRSDWATRRVDSGGGWQRLDRATPAPPGATAAQLEISFRWTTGTVWLDEVRLEPAEAEPTRRVKLASVCFVPSLGEVDRNRVAWAEQAAEAGRRGADIVCLGEGITVVGVGANYVDCAESVPGPTTEILGRVATENRMYIVAGIYERVGPDVYNTAVLIDRDGRVAGAYRKVHLPESECQAGLTPGTEYPVFTCDFGTIGIQICYDAMFPETARALALAGAEVIFTPIWGDGRCGGVAWDIVPRARAIDNGVWLVASNYSQKRSLIVDPWGGLRGDTAGSEGIIVVEADLTERRREHWLSVEAGGWWRDITVQERRPDTYDALQLPAGTVGR